MAQREDIRLHCEELNRCNQRGGRLLSLVDLFKAKTMPLDLAAFLLYRISRGGLFYHRGCAWRGRQDDGHVRPGERYSGIYSYTARG